MSGTEVLVGLVIVVGLAGILVPVLPGGALIGLAVLVWALLTGGATAWTTFAAVAVTLAVGAVVKYLVPGRRLAAAGVPRSSLVTGGLVGLVGFFVVPVLGLVLGFVGGLYLAERARLGPLEARASTGHALRAVGLSLVIELTAGVVAAGLWLGGALAT